MFKKADCKMLVKLTPDIIKMLFIWESDVLQNFTFSIKYKKGRKIRDICRHIRPDLSNHVRKWKVKFCFQNYFRRRWCHRLQKIHFCLSIFPNQTNIQLRLCLSLNLNKEHFPRIYQIPLRAWFLFFLYKICVFENK